MTLIELDRPLYFDLLLLALRGGWELYPPTIARDVEMGCSTVLMWIRIGEGN